MMDHPGTNEQWEYKVLAINMEGWLSKSVPEETPAELSELGEQGWELVNAAPVTGSGTYVTSSFALFLKRRKTS